MTTARSVLVLVILLVAVGCDGDAAPPAASQEAAPHFAVRSVPQLAGFSSASLGMSVTMFVSRFDQ